MHLCDKSTILVSSWNRNAAYVFTYENGVWIQDGLTLQPHDTPIDFGRSVAIEGNTAVIGAEGAVYIFERAANRLSQTDYSGEAIVTTQYHNDVAAGLSHVLLAVGDEVATTNVFGLDLLHLTSR